MKFLTALLFALSEAANFYSGDSNVLTLSSSNFREIVERSPKPVLVEFYSPGCPHCVNLTPTWKAVAKSLKDHVPVAAINCQADAICNKYKIQGVPSIKLFTKSDAGETIFIDYNDQRNAESIVNFAKRHIISHVIKVSETKKTDGIVALSEFLKKSPKIPHILMFKTNTMAPTMAYKTLSVDFRGKLVLGIVNLSIDSGISDKLGVRLEKDKDSIVIIKAGQEKGELYDGKMSFPDLRDFLRKVLAGASPTDQSKEDL